MHIRRPIGTTMRAIALLITTTTATAGWQDILSGVTGKLKTSSALSDADIAAGLLEALATGIRAPDAG